MDPRATVDAMLRADLRGRTAYGAPQLDVPVALNTNENSYAVPPVVVAAITEAVAGVAAGLNRYPDREFTALREALAAYLSRGGTHVSTEEVWAGNGSNEVLLHLLQAFGGPGRTALGFTPAYSMHPIITTTTGTTWVDGMRGVAGAGAFDLDVASAVEQVRRAPPARRLPLLAEQPHGHRAGPRRRRGGARRGAAARSSSSTRPTRSSPDRARRAR